VQPMKFDLMKACPGCPFLKDGPKAVRLRTGRIIEIHNSLTNWHGGSFSCHNTVDYNGLEDDEYDEDGERIHRPAPTEKHCAGALGYLANLDSDGPQGVKFMVYGHMKKTYADYGPPERCFESLHDWKATW